MSNKKFKVGDWVVCLVDGFTYIEKGKVYKIHKINIPTGSIYPFVKEDHNYISSDFRYATNAEIAQHILKEEQSTKETLNKLNGGNTMLYLYAATRTRKVQKTTEEGETYWKEVKEVLTDTPKVVEAKSETDAQVKASLELTLSIKDIELDEVTVTVVPFVA